MDPEALEKLRVAVGLGAMSTMDIFENELFAESLVDAVVQFNKLNKLMIEKGLDRKKRVNLLIGIAAVVGLDEDG